MLSAFILDNLPDQDSEGDSYQKAVEAAKTARHQTDNKQDATRQPRRIKRGTLVKQKKQVRFIRPHQFQFEMEQLRNIPLLMQPANGLHSSQSVTIGTLQMLSQLANRSPRIQFASMSCSRVHSEKKSPCGDFGTMTSAEISSDENLEVQIVPISDRRTTKIDKQPPVPVAINQHKHGQTIFERGKTRNVVQWPNSSI